MKLNRHIAVVGMFLVTALFTITLPSHAQDVTPDEARQIAKDAYVYGYPLMTMEMTRRVMTNVNAPEGTRAPMGHWVRMRAYPTAAFRDVTAPNADTLYTTTWLEVGKEPWVLSLPDAHDRYYLFPMLDAWTDVFQVPGKRTTGTGPQKYAITGPGWKGMLPEGVKEYKSPTSIVWLLGRIYCTGTTEDYAAVHKMQDAISVVPLSSYGKPFTPPPGKVDPNIDMKTAVRDQVNAMSSAAYFNMLATLMRDNPPAKDDAPIVERMARLGIIPGQPFVFGKLDPQVQQALQDVPKDSFEAIMAHFKTAGKVENGWLFTTKTGLYGTDYIQRALVTAIGLGANRPQDAVYPTSQEDSEGKAYEGTTKYVITDLHGQSKHHEAPNKYVMHFDKGQMPPVEGFWSLTMYNAEYFFVDNPLNRYTLSARNDLKKNADGSVDLYLQNENPGPDKESNWLPAPTGKFILMLRLYWPKETPPSIIDGSWEIPAVQKVK
jgi:hypothetical protein